MDMGRLRQLLAESKEHRETFRKKDSEIISLVHGWHESASPREIKDLAFILYWESPHITEGTLSKALGLTLDELLDCVGTAETTIECARCHVEIDFTISSRDEGLFIHRLTVFCPECSKSPDPHDQAEEERSLLAQREAKRKHLCDMPYDAYLQTDHWQAMRRDVLERDGHTCRVCRSTERLNVHHTTYERRGAEDLDDLTTLCADCHQLFHEHGKLARPTE